MSNGKVVTTMYFMFFSAFLEEYQNKVLLLVFKGNSSVRALTFNYAVKSTMLPRKLSREKPY